MMIESNDTSFGVDDKRQLTGTKRLYGEGPDDSPIKSINLGYNTPQNSVAGTPPIWAIPPLLPSMSCSLGALLSKLPSAVPSYNATEALDRALVNNNNNSKTTSQSVQVGNCGSLSEIQTGGDIKVESSRVVVEAGQEEKACSLNPNRGLGLEDVELGFGALRERESKSSKSQFT
uniref:Putative Serine/threonine-protein kinase WNK-related isoform 1 n=1 Tax=Davidia involucrata TaxID=16924 RepID=A0A5B6YMA9_DAVIN